MSRGEQTPPFFYLTTRVSLRSVRREQPVGAPARDARVLGDARVPVCLRRTPGIVVVGPVRAAFPLVTDRVFVRVRGAALRPAAWVRRAGAGVLAVGHTEPPTGPSSLVCLAASVAAAVSTQYYGVLDPAAARPRRSRAEPDAPSSGHRGLGGAGGRRSCRLLLQLPLIRAGAAYSSAFWSPPQWVNVPDFYIDLLTPAIVPVAVHPRAGRRPRDGSRQRSADGRSEPDARASRCTKSRRRAASSSSRSSA